MTEYVIERISDGFYFEEFVSERSASWSAFIESATVYPTYGKAKYACNKVNRKYGYKVATLKKVEK